MKTEIVPQIATHPGEILKDELDFLAISQRDFSKKIGIKPSQLNEIIKGKRNINADLALLFEKTLKIDAEYWLEVQKNYDLDLAKINSKNQKRLEAIAQMELIEGYIANKYLKSQKIITGDPVEDIIKVKEVYGVTNLEGLANINVSSSFARFRKSTSVKIDKTNLIAWVKLVQYRANELNVSNFNYEKKDSLISELKNILYENIDTLIRVKNVLSNYGVKLVYQKKGDKTPVDGISFWSHGNPAIGMSLRYNKLDNFAFTLFHELGHIFKHLLNSNEKEFIDLDPKQEESSYKDSTEEKEANLFAKNNLIKSTSYSRFYKQNNFNDTSIRRFAKANKVHPCVVKGRIAFESGNYRTKSDIKHDIL